MVYVGSGTVWENPTRGLPVIYPNPAPIEPDLSDVAVDLIHIILAKPVPTEPVPVYPAPISSISHNPDDTPNLIHVAFTSAVSAVCAPVDPSPVHVAVDLIGTALIRAVPTKLVPINDDLLITTAKHVTCTTFINLTPVNPICDTPVDTVYIDPVSNLSDSYCIVTVNPLGAHLTFWVPNSLVRQYLHQTFT
jgi:hypothetical protein